MDFTFAIALTPRANATDWELTQDLLALTLASLAAQTAPDFRVLIAGHERPRLPADPRIEFLAAPWPVQPTGPHNDDSGRKKHWLAERVLERGGGLLMVADADDWVDRRTVELARRELAGGEHGGVATRGHAVDLATLRASPLPAPGVFGEFHRVCGTSTIAVLRPQAPTAAERDPFCVLRSHHAWLERAPELGLRLRELSTGAAYVIGTSQNHSERLGPHADWFRGFRAAVNTCGAPLEAGALASYGLDLDAVRAVSRRIAAEAPAA